MVAAFADGVVQHELSYVVVVADVAAVVETVAVVLVQMDKLAVDWHAFVDVPWRPFEQQQQLVEQQLVEQQGVGQMVVVLVVHNKQPQQLLACLVVEAFVVVQLVGREDPAVVVAQMLVVHIAWRLLGRQPEVAFGEMILLVEPDVRRPVKERWHHWALDCWVLRVLVGVVDNQDMLVVEVARAVVLVVNT